VVQADSATAEANSKLTDLLPVHVITKKMMRYEAGGPCCTIVGSRSVFVNCSFKDRALGFRQRETVNVINKFADMRIFPKGNAFYEETNFIRIIENYYLRFLA